MHKHGTRTLSKEQCAATLMGLSQGARDPRLQRAVVAEVVNLKSGRVVTDHVTTAD
ncbi:hypothetical protein PC128_g8891 [Phytophthora cactorum]|nr:hypothetical protein PC128_g8891 [Phytophthora cactorum]